MLASVDGEGAAPSARPSVVRRDAWFLASFFFFKRITRGRRRRLRRRRSGAKRRELVGVGMNRGARRLFGRDERTVVRPPRGNRPRRRASRASRARRRRVSRPRRRSLLRRRAFPKTKALRASFGTERPTTAARRRSCGSRRSGAPPCPGHRQLRTDVELRAAHAARRGGVCAARAVLTGAARACARVPVASTTSKASFVGLARPGGQARVGQHRDLVLLHPRNDALGVRTRRHVSAGALARRRRAQRVQADSRVCARLAARRGVRHAGSAASAQRRCGRARAKTAHLGHPGSRGAGGGTPAAQRQSAPPSCAGSGVKAKTRVLLRAPRARKTRASRERKAERVERGGKRASNGLERRAQRGEVAPPGATRSTEGRGREQAPSEAYLDEVFAAVACGERRVHAGKTR